MTRLEDLTKGALVCGVLGDQALRLIDQEIRYRHDEARRARSTMTGERKTWR